MRTLSLEGSLDIAGARELREALAGLLEAGEPCAIEASAVERADAAAVQLLHAFAREARARGVPLAWRDPSPALREAFRLLGLERTLAAGEGPGPAGPAPEHPNPPSAPKRGV